MKIMSRTIFVTMLALALSACSPKLDGSSEKALGSSVEKMKEGLNEDQQRQFFTDLLTVSEFNRNNAENKDSKSQLKLLDGMTREDLDKRAKEVRLEIAARNKAGQIRNSEFTLADKKKKIADMEPMRKVSFQVVEINRNDGLYFHRVKIKNETGVPLGSVDISNNEDGSYNNIFTFNPPIQPNEAFEQEFTTQQQIKPTFVLLGAAMPKHSPNYQYFNVMEYNRALEAIDREEKLLSTLKN